MLYLLVVIYILYFDTFRFLVFYIILCYPKIIFSQLHQQIGLPVDVLIFLNSFFDGLDMHGSPDFERFGAPVFLVDFLKFLSFLDWIPSPLLAVPTQIFSVQAILASAHRDLQRFGIDNSYLVRSSEI